MDPYKKLSSLQEISKAQLSKIFSINTNKKFLVIESSLIKPLERVCGLQWLRSSGIDRIFKLEPLSPNFEDKAVFYMIPSDLQSFAHVLEQIRSQVDILNNPPTNKFHVIVIPRFIRLFEEELEQYGLLESAVKLHSFQWMPIHLDTGILSLEMPLLYKTVFVDESYNLLSEMAKVLWQLMLVVGKPNVTISLGRHSSDILKLVEDTCESKGEPDVVNPDFGALIIIDRSVDYASALLTPGIYSGLLSEIYAVKCGICDSKSLKESETGSEQILDDKFTPVKKKQPVNITLNAQQDPVYGDIRNRYFTQVTAVLSNLTKQLKSEQLSSQEMALDEIKRYVQTQLQATKCRKQFITQHLLASESVINVLGHKYERQKQVEIDLMQNCNKSATWNYLNEVLLSENDMRASLRLFCLMAISQGLGEREVSGFRRKFVQQFGFYGFAFKTLEKLTLNPVKTGKLKLPTFTSSNFYANAKTLRQIPTDPDKVNLHHPTCASYVFGGAYIPLITQIAGLLLNSVPLDEIRLKLEPFGPLSLRNDRGYPLLCRNILIFVVGGVTYAEIAACNLLETLMGSRICVLSDRVVTGSDLMGDILSV